MQATGSFADLVRIMDLLREECPWDRKQNFATLRRYLIEECFEAVDALDRGELPELCVELGDLLLQIVFLSRLAREQGAFAAQDVVRGIAEKLIRRHPHVFGEGSAADADDVEANWERIKRQEKSDSGVRRSDSLLDDVPGATPALPQARLLGERAARIGFDWADANGVCDKVQEEFGELRQALAGGPTEQIGEEIGDLLFSIAMLARKLKIDPDAALAASNRKFRRRFALMEAVCRQRDQDLASLTQEGWEKLWREAKMSQVQ